MNPFGGREIWEHRAHAYWSGHLELNQEDHVTVFGYGGVPCRCGNVLLLDLASSIYHVQDRAATASEDRMDGWL
jgi:hypothetical protein